uniref:Uncharacterized protein n=1 Tax=Timema poppense TaxID=170557 RepID=A0A7R9DID8_TIMPO|nr:unnamed protein product [Timema poppensis]
MRRFTDLFSTADLCKNDRLAVTLLKRRFGRSPRCTRRGAQTSSVQTQTAMEKVTCSCNMVEDHLPSVAKSRPENSQPSLAIKTFYLNDKQNNHVVVGIFLNSNFYAQVMFSSNSKRLILTVPQWNFFVKEMPSWFECVENSVNFESNTDDFSVVVKKLFGVEKLHLVRRESGPLILSEESLQNDGNLRALLCFRD